MTPDLDFDGQILRWRTQTYRATSGLSGHQYPRYQCTMDAGPVPDGLYKVYLTDAGQAKDDGKGVCNLEPAWGIQTIPRGSAAGACEPYWANWGYNRVRLEPADAQTRHACSPQRGGFYLHDSAKGYSHGCIEVEHSFFVQLRAESTLHPGGHLILKVHYVADRITNGGTRAQP